MSDRHRSTGLSSLILALGVLGLMHGGLAAAEAPGAEQPVPPAAAQEQARKLIREVYKPEYDAAKTPAQRSALAKKMLGEAAKSGDDAAGCYVLYCTARDVAVAAGDVETALAAVDQLAALFKVDALPMKEEVLQSLSKPPATPEQLVLVAEQAFVLVEEAVAADNYEAAGRLGDLALAAARRTKNVEAVRQITARNKQVAAMAREYAQVKEAMVTLDQKPTDPEANLAVGRFLCLNKDRWESGVSMLALGSDPAVQAVAEKDIYGATKPEEQVALGDQWWALAETREGPEKQGWKRRAGMWYEQAQGQGVAGLAKAKIDKRLAEIAAAGGTRPPIPTRDVAPGGEIPLGQWIDVLRWVDPPNDGDSTDWKWDGGALVTRPGRGGKKLCLPVSVEGAYDLALDVTQPDQGSVHPILPVGSRNVNVVCGSEGCGLGWVNGENWWNNPTTNKKSRTVLGRRHRLLVSVRPEGNQASIGVSMDGVPVIQWQGAQRSLSALEVWHPKQPYLTAWDATVIWHRVYFRLVSGKATRIARP